MGYNGKYLNILEPPFIYCQKVWSATCANFQLLRRASAKAFFALRAEKGLSRCFGQLQAIFGGGGGVGEVPQFTGDNAGSLKHKFDNAVSEKVKAALSVERRKHWESHVKELTVQGNFLALAAAEREDVVWKSHMFDLKQRTLKFLLNASIDTLPTAANLKRWKKYS